MCGFEMLSTNLSVWKTLPSKARVTRDRVSWITICAKKLCLKDNTISTALQAELLMLAFLWTLRAQLRSFSLGIALQA